MNHIHTAESNRIKLILSYTNIFTLCFSVLYSLLLVASFIDNNYIHHTDEKMFPVYSAFFVPAIFTCSYILNRKDKLVLSKLLLICTILVVNFIAGLKWGFDLPSVILSYVFCIVIVALTSKTKESVLYNLLIVASICVGTFLRDYFTIPTTWHNNAVFGFNDIVEFSIMFFFIAFILIKFNQEQNKTLNRALRVEYMLKKERDELELKVQEKTKEIKQIQMEEISKMYHLIEFGKLSSGLYHDLITPIQTMNLYIEKLSKEELIHDSKFSKIVLNIKNTHDKLTRMLQNIRKQMTLHIEDEKFNLVTEIQDIVNLVKNSYLKNYVTLELEYESGMHIVESKASVISHVVLNLISNAYEACLQDRERNAKDEYKIQVRIGKYDHKNYISVIDNGIGIKDENIEKIFEDFYSSKDQTGQKQNCGIGLSSARYYTEKHLSGRIFVESEYETGTTMTVLFKGDIKST